MSDHKINKLLKCEINLELYRNKIQWLFHFSANVGSLQCIIKTIITKKNVVNVEINSNHWNILH